MQILESAVNLIVKAGYYGFSMRKLAGTLGITTTTIYNYYTNNYDLNLHLLIRGLMP